MQVFRLSNRATRLSLARFLMTLRSREQYDDKTCWPDHLITAQALDGGLVDRSLVIFAVVHRRLCDPQCALWTSRTCGHRFQYSARMPWRNVWIPPKPGIPPWLPPNMTGGYWHREYVPTGEEIRSAQRTAQAAALRGRERAKAVVEASGPLLQARTPTEVGRLLIAKPDLTAFDEASCSSAWQVLVKSGVYPATHHLIAWKARHREWGFYFRWLPDYVVRRTNQPASSLWEVPGTEYSWIDAKGDRYRVAGTSPMARATARDEMKSGLLDIGSTYYGLAVVPRGHHFRTEHRVSDGHTRPEHYVKGGFHIEPDGLPRGMNKVNAADIARLLSSRDDSAAA
jgi:hypothetical protein